MKIRKGDTVVVLSGKDRGKQGKAERVFPKDGTVLVPGVNQYKKHVKKQNDRPGEVVTISRPILVSRIAVVCPKCKQQTRVGYQLTAGKKVRVCRKCDMTI